MMEETITFELIRKVQLEEQKTSKLSKLPEDFFKNACHYLKQKERMVEIREDKKVISEVKSIRHMIEDIFNRRERKILNHVLIFARAAIKPENLTSEESEFFQRVLEIVKERREKFFVELAQEKLEGVSLIIFKEDFPAFVAEDLKTYGPFRKNDIARLPEESMKMLVKKGIAEEFKVKK